MNAVRAVALTIVVAGAIVTGAAQPAAATAVPPYRAVTVESPSPEAKTVFGEIMHTVGDVDRDGVRDVITTAENTVGGLQGVGRVWVLSGRTGAVLLTLDDPDPQLFAGFGVSLAGLGDVNGDGIADLTVAAPFQSVFTGSGTGCGRPEPNGCNESQGKVYVFSGSDGRLLYSVADPRPQPNAFFGALFSTATGDLNGDGVPDFVEPANGEDVGGVPRAGAAYVLSGKDGSVIRRIPNPSPEPFDFSESIYSMGLTNPDGGCQRSARARLPGQRAYRERDPPLRRPTPPSRRVLRKCVLRPRRSR